jgi:hypothetical protein
MVNRVRETTAARQTTSTLGTPTKSWRSFSVKEAPLMKMPDE